MKGITAPLLAALIFLNPDWESFTRAPVHMTADRNLETVQEVASLRAEDSTAESGVVQEIHFEGSVTIIKGELYMTGRNANIFVRLVGQERRISKASLTGGPSTFRYDRQGRNIYGQAQKIDLSMVEGLLALSGDVQMNDGVSSCSLSPATYSLRELRILACGQ
jgi:hypothetical protein